MFTVAKGKRDELTIDFGYIFEVITFLFGHKKRGNK